MPLKETTIRQRPWSDLSPTQRRLSLTATTLNDIYWRPADQICGSRWAWPLASFASFIGPSASFALG